MSVTETETADEAAPTEDSADVETPEVDVGTEEEEDEELEPVEIDMRPPRAGQAIALVAALVGVGLSAPFTVLSIPFGLAGLALAAMALTYKPSSGWFTIGVALMFAGALISGGFGVLPPEVMLLAIGSIIVSWDAGQHAVSLGNQIGRQTRSHRNQLVHSAATVLAVTIASGALFVVFAIGGDGHPAPAVALIIIGIVLAAWLLRK